MSISSLELPKMNPPETELSNDSKTTLGDSSSGGGTLNGRKVVPIASPVQEQVEDSTSLNREPCCSSISACITAFCACIVFCDFKSR